MHSRRRLKALVRLKEFNRFFRYNVVWVDGVYNFRYIIL